MSDTINIAIEWFVNFFQGIVFVTFCYKYFDKRYEKKLNIIFFITAVVLMFAAITTLNYFSESFAYIEVLVFMAIMITYCIVALEGKLYLKIIIPLLIYLLYLSIAFGTNFFITAILNINAEYLMTTSSIYRYLTMLIINLTYVFVLYVIYGKIKYSLSLKSFVDIFSFVLLPLVTLAVVILTLAISSDKNTSNTSRLFLGIIVIAEFFISIVIFYLLTKISQSNEIKTRNLIMLKEQEMYKEEIKSANKYINEIAEIKHDIKNKVMCIGNFIDENNIDEAKKMCNDITGELEASHYVFSTDNIYLNAILNSLYQKAKELGIDIKVNVKSALDCVDGSDIISIIGNLGDNAIEALDKMQNCRKDMSIFILQKGSYYVISVKNIITESILVKNQKLQSNKGDSLLHGHGLRIVRNISEKYKGSLSFSEESHYFYANVMLEIPTTTK